MKKILILLFGTSIAGVLGYKIGYYRSKKHYEGLADEEVASIRKTLMARYERQDHGSSKVIKKEKEENKNKPIDRPKSTKVVDEPSIGYDYGKKYRTATEPDRIPGTPGNEVKHLKKEELDTTKPYVITPEEFHDSEFESVTLYYFPDKVLTDDDFNQIKNIGIIGGYPILEKMGMYDSDCLYVRDEKNGIDYEILLDERPFSKIRPLGVVEED